MDSQVLMRIKIPDEYLINARQITIAQLQEHLDKPRPAVILNFYAQKYGVHIKEFPYLPKVGYFVDIDRRVATHSFICHGIERRDKILKDEIYQPLIPEIYRMSWFDLKDAVRSYAVIIEQIKEIDEPIPLDKFMVYSTNLPINPDDQLHHPRMVNLNL